jgi:kynurenine formamidase
MVRRVVSLAFAAMVVVAPHVAAAQPPAPSRAPHNVAEVKAMMAEISNWGRWGKDDQLGTMNLITPAKRKQAAALVKDGVSVSLARDSELEKAADVGSPYERKMLNARIDMLTLTYHGFANTHMDALWHGAFEGRSYNGVTSSEGWENGVPALSVLNLKQGIFTRGVLVDLTRLKRVKYLEPGTAIYAEDLEAWEKMTGTRIGSGDAVFIYTGRWARRTALGPWDVGAQAAGLHASVAKWLKARDVAVVGHDGGDDLAPSLVEGVRFPLHALLIAGLGMPLLDNCDLEAVAAEAAMRNRWEFLLTVAPLAIKGGTGSPVNPVATF